LQCDAEKQPQLSPPPQRELWIAHTRLIICLQHIQSAPQGLHACKSPKKTTLSLQASQQPTHS